MNTGWRAARQSRRPHTKRKIESGPQKNRAGKARRTAVKNAVRALRMKGLLP